MIKCGECGKDKERTEFGKKQFWGHSEQWVCKECVKSKGYKVVKKEKWKKTPLYKKQKKK